jgi:murein DD-endopeptidase MepM/ murein hydrolase activator NlpD
MKNDRAKRRLAFALAALIALAFTPYASAVGDDEKEYRNQLTDVHDQIDDATNQLKEGKKESSALASEIKALDNKIYEAEVEINALQGDINETKTEITQVLAELDEAQADVDSQNEDLNERLRAMYKSGDIGMLSVLLGSSTISEAMTNMDMVQRIYDSDTELLAQLQANYDVIDGKRKQLVALKDKLESQQALEKEKQDALAADKNAVAAKKKEVDKDNKELEAQIDALNKEASELTAKILKLQSAGEYVGGSMLWPAAASTTVSSPFGYRIHPILKVNKMHTGIDIAAAGGTNILAANAGTVITAGWNNSYGYMVMIDHGGGIVTLYAHSSKLLVSKGDIVTRGQTIAKVGSTGMSTGNHLHFEVRVNGVYKNPLEYVSASVRR